MTDSAYRELMRKAVAYMRRRNEEAWGIWSLGDLPRFDWDQERGQLTFSGEGRDPIVADIQFVGSWSETAGTWMWAWANDSVLEPMKREVQEVREFGRSNDLEELTDPVWEAPIEAAWDMTALGCLSAEENRKRREHCRERRSQGGPVRQEDRRSPAAFGPSFVGVPGVVGAAPGVLRPDRRGSREEDARDRWPGRVCGWEDWGAAA